MTMAPINGSTREHSSEAGFSVAELLISTMIGLLVLGAAVSLFTAGIATQPRIDERVSQIQLARTMSERITRELRQGSNASSVNPSQLMILTYVPMSTYCNTPATSGSSIARCRVFYSCPSAGSTSSCTRVECPSALLAIGTGCSPPTTVVSGLTTNQVFSFSPRTPGQAYVGVRLEFPAENGDDAITIQDGVALRNPPLGGP
jgi:hypothetical protein